MFRNDGTEYLTNRYDNDCESFKSELDSAHESIRNVYNTFNKSATILIDYIKELHTKYILSSLVTPTQTTLKEYKQKDRFSTRTVKQLTDYQKYVAAYYERIVQLIIAIDNQNTIKSDRLKEFDELVRSTGANKEQKLSDAILLSRVANQTIVENNKIRKNVSKLNQQINQWSTFNDNMRNNIFSFPGNAKDAPEIIVVEKIVNNIQTFYADSEDNSARNKLLDSLIENQNELYQTRLGELKVMSLKRVKDPPVDGAYVFDAKSQMSVSNSYVSERLNALRNEVTSLALDNRKLAQKDSKTLALNRLAELDESRLNYLLQVQESVNDFDVDNLMTVDSQPPNEFASAENGQIKSEQVAAELVQHPQASPQAPVNGAQQLQTSPVATEDATIAVDIKKDSPSTDVIEPMEATAATIKRKTPEKKGKVPIKKAAKINENNTLNRINSYAMRIQLNDQDLTILNSQNEWYTDNIMNRILEMIKKGSNDVYPFVDVLTTSTRLKPNIKLKNNAILFLFNENRRHWICAFYNAEANMFSLYDTLSTSLQLSQLNMEFVEKITEKPAPNIQLEKVDQQKNANDCGPMAVAIATALYFGHNPTQYKFKPDLRNLIYDMVLTNVLNELMEPKIADIPSTRSRSNSTSSISSFSTLYYGEMEHFLYSIEKLVQQVFTYNKLSIYINSFSVYASKIRDNSLDLKNLDEKTYLFFYLVPFHSFGEHPLFGSITNICRNKNVFERRNQSHLTVANIDKEMYPKNIKPINAAVLTQYRLKGALRLIDDDLDPIDDPDMACKNHVLMIIMNFMIDTLEFPYEIKSVSIADNFVRFMGQFGNYVP